MVDLGTEQQPDPAGGQAAEIAKVLLANDNFLIAGHRRPDGDCIGSASALLAILRQLGKNAVAYNESEVPRRLFFIPYSHEISRELPDEKPDVTVLVDCGGINRVSSGFEPHGIVVNIDHHSSNDFFGDYNFVDPAATSVGELIFLILRALDADLTPEIATCLYAAISSDTGSFRYPSTREKTFYIAGALTGAGADPAAISRFLFESRSPEEITLTSRCYSRLSYECHGRMTWSELRWNDYVEVGGMHHEPEGLSTEIRSIDGVEISMLFHELEGGGIRVSMRSKDMIDCAALAESIGGGGHFSAAGYTNDSVDYETERDRVIQLARKAVGEALSQ